MQEIFDRIIWGNALKDYLVVIAGMTVVWAVLKLVRKKLLLVIRKLTARTQTDIDDLVLAVSEKFIIPWIYLLIQLNIAGRLTLPPGIRKAGAAAALMISVYYLVRMLNYSMHRSITMFMERKGEAPERIRQIDGMLLVVKGLFWLIGLVLVADNLGYDITAMIAGLGVGGIAIALAAQNILGDLFSYLVIFFDKPFEIGDFIVAANTSGVVEKVGIKTTRLRSLDGQQLILPNAEMAKTLIQNYKRLQRRRVVFRLGVVYYTSSKKLRLLPEIIEDIIAAQPLATFDRAHLVNFGDFSITYEVVYYVESDDYRAYMDTHHAISLRLFEKFETEGIEFAYPTQTVFLGNPSNQPERMIRDGSANGHEHDHHMKLKSH